MPRNDVRIGELARRVGVSPDLLRVWERRYGLLSPTRSDGGHRLYSTDDELRVRRMQVHLAAGTAAAEAASRALSEDANPNRVEAGHKPDLAEQTAALTAALDALDDARAQAIVDRLLADNRLQDVLTGAIFPYLDELGARWQRGEASIAMEHFASALIRGRLLALARDWDSGEGPRVVLACPRGELHEIALIALGLLLREQGLRVTYLGADVSLDMIRSTCIARAPAAVVLAATRSEIFECFASDIRTLARNLPVFLAGPAATLSTTTDLGAKALTGDPARVADQLTELIQTAELA